jgi:DNA polymerase epsilon subunit 2
MLSSSVPSNLSNSRTILTLKKLNQLVWKVFTKSYGLTLQADAATFLSDKITNYSMNENQTTEFLNYMAQNYSKISKDRSGMVSKQNIELVFNQVYQSQDYKESGKGHHQDIRKYIKVLDSFNTPKFEYDVHGKVFKKLKCNDGMFSDSAKDKISFNLRRFNIVKQRILKRLRSETIETSSKMTSLTSIKSIKGINSPNLERYVFGLITEMSEGIFSLEDPEDFITLDFSSLKEYPKDFIMEGGLFLVKGICLGNRFVVQTISSVPCEERKETISMLTYPDVSDATNFAEPLHELKEMELQAKNARFVIISEVWLDQPQILERLKILFDGFNAQGSLPELFILVGPFSSNPPKDGPRAWSHYQDLFDGFAEFIERIKNVRQCRFVFVPAGNDPGFVDSMLPRPSIPESIFDAWRRAKFDFISTSNPCRIVYFSQEIVIFKNEITQQMRTKSLNSHLTENKEKEKEVEEDLESSTLGQGQGQELKLTDYQKSLKSCLDQSTLSPFSLSDQTVLWDCDHSLSLYPIPDVLIVAERQNCYEFSYEDCKCANPGSFPSSEGSFLLYSPAQKRFDLCELPKKQ